MIKDLTYKKIFLFWAPLAATWLMMSVEGPFLAAIISRLPEPKFNLAAYGVAFSFALIVEAPIIMIMSASTALVKGYRSFEKLKKFTWFLNYSITALMLILIIPPVFDFFAKDLIELPDNVAKLTHLAVMILLPWPGMIGYRRFYQGIMIRNNLARKVAYGTVIRLVSMASSAFLLYFFTDIPGVATGAAALSIGVTSEGLASRFMAGSIIKELKKNAEKENETAPSYKKIFNFYYPLALTSIIALGVNPMVTFFMGQARFPIESLAVLPVVNGLVFIFRSLGLSYQEAAIALAGDKLEYYKPVRNFGYILGLSASAVLFIIGFTPVMNLWYSDLSGLTAELTEFAKTPTMIMTLMPALTALISLQRALLVAGNKTSPVTWATITEVGGILLVLFAAISLADMTGVIAASLAYLIGRSAACLYLYAPVKTITLKARLN